MANFFMRSPGQRLDGHQHGDLYRVFFNQLVGEFAGPGRACNMAALVRVGGSLTPMYSHNSPGAHAEENLFLQNGTGLLSLAMAIIDIEPCHSGRYPGHNCSAYFAGGKVYKGQHRQFVPAMSSVDCPILYLQSQPSHGEHAHSSHYHGIRSDIIPMLDSYFFTPQGLIPLGRS